MLRCRPGDVQHYKKMIDLVSLICARFVAIDRIKLFTDGRSIRNSSRIRATGDASLDSRHAVGLFEQHNCATAAI